MRIEILRACFAGAGVLLELGQKLTVSDDLGADLVKLNRAIEVDEPKKPAKPEKAKK